MLRIIDLVRDSSDVTSTAAARVPRAEHVDRDDSAAARLDHRGCVTSNPLLLIVNRSLKVRCLLRYSSIRGRLL